MAGVTDLKPRLEAAVRAAMDEESPDNPVYRATQNNVIRDSAGTNFERHVVDSLSKLEDSVNFLEQNYARNAGAGARAVGPLSSDAMTNRLSVTVQGDDDAVTDFRRSLSGQISELRAIDSYL